MKILMLERMVDMQKIEFFAKSKRGEHRKAQYRRFFVLPVFIH